MSWIKRLLKKPTFSDKVIKEVAFVFKGEESTAEDICRYINAVYAAAEYDEYQRGGGNGNEAGIERKDQGTGGA